MQDVHADTTGPFPMTKNGNTYLLVIRDRLTKFIWLIPIKEKKADIIQEKLREVFLTFGFPSKLVTDRGKEFSIKKINQLLKEKRDNANLRRISPLAPRSNGEAENAMRYIKDILVAYINKFHDNWDEHIKEIQSIMNSYISDATGYTPNYLMLGRELPQLDETYFQTKCTGKPNEFREIMEYIWESVGTKIVTTNVDKFNKQTREPLKFKPYKVEDFVFIKRIPRKTYKNKNEEERYINSRKLQYRYTGPFMILEKRSDVSYVLDIHGKARPIHAINMKPS
jgi:hypothetical protein